MTVLLGKITSLSGMLKFLLILAFPLSFSFLSACENSSQNPYEQAPSEQLDTLDKPEKDGVVPHPAPPPKAGTVDELLEGLVSRLAAQPDDVDGWVLLARSYQYLGRPDQAETALTKARELGYEGPDVTAGLSENSRDVPQPRPAPGRSSNFVHEPIYRVMEEVGTGQPLPEKD